MRLSARRPNARRLKDVQKKKLIASRMKHLGRLALRRMIPFQDERPSVVPDEKSESESFVKKKPSLSKSARKSSRHWRENGWKSGVK